MSDPNTNAPDPQPEPAAAPAVHPPSEPAASRPEAFSWQRGADAGAGAQPASQRPEPAAPARDGGSRSDASAPRLSTFLKVSIVLLAGLTIASISLLFIGDFEGKFERVFSTFALFAVFVLFTALDTRRGQKSEWYAPVALIANAYILGLLLIVIWMTPYDSFSLMWEIFWKSVFVILVTRLVILCCQLLLQLGSTAVVTRFAFVTSVLAVLSGILFTAPVGIEAFDLYIPDLYWKIATALLILTALGLSITLLLRWSYGADAREAARAAKAGASQPAVAAAGQQPWADQAHRASGAESSAPPARPAPEPPAGAPQSAASQSAAPQQAQQAPPLLPWPTFSDGRPLPARADGQPDFSVLGHGQPDAPR